MVSETAYLTDILQWFASNRIVERVWARDPSVFADNSSEGTHPASMLGWLNPLPLTLCAQHKQEWQDLVAFATQTAGKYRDVVVIGMGGSIMSVKAFKDVFSGLACNVNLYTIDEPYKQTINLVSGRIDLKKTLFIAVSKSGSTAETLAITDAFKALCYKRGVVSNFVAITQSSSEMLTRNQNLFSKTFTFPKSVGGRYSALSVVGLLPLLLTFGSTVISRDMRFTQNLKVMHNQCNSNSSSDNPALLLAAQLYHAAINEYQYINIALPKQLAGFGMWLEQLLAESLGKHGRGVVPIINEPILSRQRYGDNRTYIAINFSNNSLLIPPVHHANSISISSYEDIGAEMFKWMFATVLTGIAIGINPLDEPDVNLSKEFTRKYINSAKTFPLPDKKISIENALHKVLSKNPGYIAIVGWFPQTEITDTAIAKLRAAITNKTKLPTVFCYAPSYLHSTGQLFKGGPNNVCLIALKPDTLPKNEADTLEQLVYSQLLGDIDAMTYKYRFAVLCNVESDYTHAINLATERIELQA